MEDFNEEELTDPWNQYLVHLLMAFQQQPEFRAMRGAHKDSPDIYYLLFKDWPEPGYMTVVTYGLSLVENPRWKTNRKELCMTVNASTENWQLIVPYMANRLRGDCPFEYANTLNLGQPIDPGSKMDCFFVATPGMLKREEFLDIEIGADYKIDIQGFYPMYAEELQSFNELGVAAFLKRLDVEAYNVKRERISV